MMLMYHSLLIHLCVLNYFTITTRFRITITFHNILIADPKKPRKPFGRNVESVLSFR